MKIAVACYESLGEPGGSAIQVLRLAEALESHGHDVVLYAPAITRAAGTTVRVSYLPLINIPGLRFISYLLLGAPLLLLRLLFSRPRVLLAFEVYFDASHQLAARLAGIPLYLFVNAIAEEEMDLGGPGSPLRRVMGMIRGATIRAARGVFTISPEIASWLERVHSVTRGNISVVRNGVDAELFAPADRAASAAALGLDPSFKYVGFVGRVAPWHGLEYLVAAAPGLLDLEPSARFLIVGEGPALPALKRSVEERGLAEKFIFTGNVPHSSVPVYINAFDVCVVFYRAVRSYPGDPMKMYEYLACGRPVLAGNAPGYGDLVLRAGAGLSVDPERTEEVSSAIARLLGNDGLRAEMGRRGREEAVRAHSWKARARDISEFMKV